jgi:hypothetical protein
MVGNACPTPYGAFETFDFGDHVDPDVVDDAK